jgi:hypothetical protein
MKPNFLFMLTEEQEKMFNELAELTENKKRESDQQKRNSLESKILQLKSQFMRNLGFKEYIKFMNYAGILLT